VLDGEIDAVYIATPNALHHPVAVSAARAKKHVLCEKPMSLSVPTAREMVDACRASGVMLKVGFQLRFEQIMCRVRELIKSDAIGELRSLAVERTAPLDQTGTWRRNPNEGGGILFDVGVHLLDLAQWLAESRITEVFARAHPDPREGKANDTVAISGLLGKDCNVLIRASREMPFARNDLVLEGSRGMISTSSLRWADEYVLSVTTESGLREERLPATPAYKREIEAFEREIRGQTTPLATGEEGVRIVELAEAVLTSINSARSVSL
jgi:predicted dehydrogenase